MRAAERGCFSFPLWPEGPLGPSAGGCNQSAGRSLCSPGMTGNEGLVARVSRSCVHTPKCVRAEFFQSLGSVLCFMS